MSEITFIYQGYDVNIHCKKNEKMKTILERLCDKLKIKKVDIYGLYNGNIVDENIGEEKILANENNKKVILIYDNSDNKKDKYQKSKEVLCPKCHQICLLDIKDNKISLFNCKNKHTINNILINEFNETQKINISKIICELCKRCNKGETHNNEFFKCLTCKINLCPLCNSTHNKEHNIINYDQKNFICEEHGESYFAFCKECQKNICNSCESGHCNHDIISYGKILGDKNKILDRCKILRKDIDKFNDIIKDIINKLNKVIDNMENYYVNYKDIIDTINNKNRNYELLFNINKMNDNSINDDIKNIINEKNINKQINNIIKIYTKFNIKYKNEITIQYKINKNDDEIDIFGSEFVDNNRDKCKYIYENKIYELNQVFNLDKNKKLKDILEIKLINIQNITNLGCLFYNCVNLISVPDIHEINTSNITDINSMFHSCWSLKSLPDISIWDTSKINDISYIFWDCHSLISLPDISIWDTSKVTNMEGIFGCCQSLKSLPDISKWNTSKNTSLKEMFKCCESLVSLPDISKWDLSKVEYMGSIRKGVGMFYGCKLLTSLPDISKWNTSNVISMMNLFGECSSLKSLPDISKWNTSKINNISYMFENCKSLVSIPDISKWKINKNVNIENIFYGCSKLENKPCLFNE